MTLDDAINHIEEVIQDTKTRCPKCAEEHEQLKIWLEELKAYKVYKDYIATQTLKIAPGDLFLATFDPDKVDVDVASQFMEMVVKILPEHCSVAMLPADDVSIIHDYKDRKDLFDKIKEDIEKEKESYDVPADINERDTYIREGLNIALSIVEKTIKGNLIDE